MVNSRRHVLIVISWLLFALQPAVFGDPPQRKPISVYVLEVDTNIKGDFAAAAGSLTQALEAAFSKKSSTFLILERRRLNEIVKANQLEKELQTVLSGKSASVSFAQQVRADAFIRGELIEGPDGAVLRVWLTRLNSEILWQGRAKHTKAEWLLQRFQDEEADKMAADAEAHLTQSVPISLAGAEATESTVVRGPGEEFDLGRMAAIAGHFPDAVLHFRRAAEAGNVDAMNMIGFLYTEGRGVPRDYEKARQWYEKAAMGGNVNAMVDLGVLYDSGKGGRLDHVLARQWYEKAASSGSAVAMHNLAYLYENGIGVGQDHVQARQWYEKCAALDDSECMKNIGILYQLGTGVKQDLAQARQWYEKAAAAGSAAAMNNLGTFYANGEGVKQDFDQANKWWEKAAAGGSADGMKNLGYAYAKGWGVEQDYEKARYWFERAAAAGDQDAAELLKALPK